MINSLLLVTLLAYGPATTTPRVTHTRPLSEIARTVVSEAERSSPTIASMIAAIERSDVIVYVNATVVSTSSGGGWTRFVGASESARFLEVTIDLSLDRDRRAEILAHELQHVLEVARAGTVRDAAGMKRLFNQIGWTSGARDYETAAAISVERQVHQELWKSRSRPPA